MTTKQILTQIFGTKIGWLIISFLLVVIFAILSNYYPWAEYAMYGSLVYPVVLLIIMMVYGWIINPIRDKKK